MLDEVYSLLLYVGVQLFLQEEIRVENNPLQHFERLGMFDGNRMMPSLLQVSSAHDWTGDDASIRTDPLCILYIPATYPLDFLRNTEALLL